MGGGGVSIFLIFYYMGGKGEGNFSFLLKRGPKSVRVGEVSKPWYYVYIYVFAAYCDQNGLSVEVGLMS